MSKQKLTRECIPEKYLVGQHRVDAALFAAITQKFGVEDCHPSEKPIWDSLQAGIEGLTVEFVGEEVKFTAAPPWRFSAEGLLTALPEPEPEHN